MKKTVVILFILACLSCSGCGDIEINSLWKSTNLSIDGNDDDWNGNLVSLDKLNAAIGIINDNENLYLCLSTSDPIVENKVLSGGLTLWFQPGGAESGKIGIRFPLGMNDSVMPRPDEDMKPGERPVDPSKMQEEMFKRQSDLEIIQSNNKQRIPLAQLRDIQLKASLTNGKLVYEIKVPLGKRSSSDFYLNTAPGGSLTIAVKSDKPDFSRMMGGMPPQGGFDMPPGGDEGPGGGGPGGGPGEGPGGGFFPGGMGRGFSALEPLDFSIEVNLASAKK